MKALSSVEIRKSPKKVLDYVCHTNNTVNWRSRFVESGITSVGGVKEGATSFTTIAVRKYQMTIYWKLVSYEKGSRAKWEITSGPFYGTTCYHCDKSEFGTFFTIETNVRLRKPFGFIASPFIWLAIQYNNRKDVLLLKELLEA